MTSSPIPKNPEPALNQAAPLSVENPGDALALVQHTFGYLPEDSLVLIGLMDGQTGGHLRVDLSSEVDSACALGYQCATWIAGPDAFPLPEAVLAMVFDSHTPDPDAPDRHDPLLASLADGLEAEADVPLVKIWHCGAGRIRDYECHDSACCPYPGHQAAQAMEDSLQRVPQLTETRACSPQEAVAGFLSSSPPISQDQITEVRDHPTDSPPGPDAVVTVWDAAICRGLRQSEAEGNLDCQWLHVSPGRAAGLLGTLEDHPNVGLLMAVATTGMHMVFTSAEQLSSRVWGTSASPPPWERIDALDSLLHQLVPYAEQQQLAEILGLKAWIEWIRGRGSHATAFAEEVQHLAPQRWDNQTHPPLARSVLRCIATVGVCPWAQVKESSYSWWSAQKAPTTSK